MMTGTAKSPRRIPEDITREVVRRYEAGETSPAIAQQLGVSAGFAQNAVRRAGLTLRKPGMQPRFKDPTEVARLYESGLSTTEISAQLNASVTAIITALRLAGVTIRTTSDYSGEKCRRWKGGRTKHVAGYVLRFLPKHPRAGSNGYVLEHLVVAEELTGALIPDDMEVHHRNEIKTDNRPPNLWVISHKHHKMIHAEIRLRRAQPVASGIFTP